MHAIVIFNKAFSACRPCRIMRIMMLAMAIWATSFVFTQASAQTNEASTDQELIARIAAEFGVTATSATSIFNLMQTGDRLRSSGDTLLAAQMDRLAIASGILGRFELDALGIMPRMEAGVRGTPVPEPLATEVKAAARLYIGGMSMAANVSTTIIEIVFERALATCRERNPDCLPGLNRAIEVAKVASSHLNSIVSTVPSWAMAGENVRLLY